MATPVEITLKRNETSSFPGWHVGGGELGWERLGLGGGAGGRGGSWVGRGCRAAEVPYGVPVLGQGAQQGWGHVGTPPPPVATSCWQSWVTRFWLTCVLCWGPSTLTWWGEAGVLPPPPQSGCQGQGDRRNPLPSGMAVAGVAVSRHRAPHPAWEPPAPACAKKRRDTALLKISLLFYLESVTLRG